MESKRLYVDFHVLQTVPPSCVNRDDTGSPKTAVYGGTTRARVSSQAWKRAMRLMFATELLDSKELGIRTKKIVRVVSEQIENIDPACDAKKLALDALEKVGFERKKLLKAEKDTQGESEGADNDVLLFIGAQQARALAELIVQDSKLANEATAKSSAEELEEESTSKKKKEKSKVDQRYVQAMSDNPTLDMVLFGRMVAKNPSLNYDAAVQVAHSISTHAVENEFDFFTALDDLSDGSGAAHLSTKEYNSATLYRYADVNVLELVRSFGKEKATQAVRYFAEAFIRSMPTGSQNSYANRTLPDAVYVTLRTDQPVNLCGAFEKAVPATANGFVGPSKAALADYAQKVYTSYADAPQQAFTVGDGLETLAPAQPLGRMLDALETAVGQQLGAETGNGVE